MILVYPLTDFGPAIYLPKLHSWHMKSLGDEEWTLSKKHANPLREYFLRVVGVSTNYGDIIESFGDP